MTKTLSENELEMLFDQLKDRFENNMNRHPDMTWPDIKQRLADQQEVLFSLNEMERTGGEPDVVGNVYVFVDCAPESPKGRRSVCYDRPALDARKKNKPENDAQTMAADMGIELLSEEEYRNLQTFGEFDLKSSSWIKTPENIRKLGGAIFCDRRYDTVFSYHNGAESYYSSRGFRGKLNF